MKRLFVLMIAIVVVVIGLWLINKKDESQTNITDNNLEFLTDTETETSDEPEPVAATSTDEILTDTENTSNQVFFDLTVQNWKFDPKTITVQTGDTVTLKVTSIDSDHGLAIPDFKVDQFIKAGETVEITFMADKKGAFPFTCNVYCGEGHDDMRGTLIVQ